MADGFLGRWSRRKQDVLAGKPVKEPPAPAVKAPVPAPAAATPLAAGAQDAAQPASGDGAPVVDALPAPTLSDAQALTPASDFKPFVDRAVSPEVRNLAMKKLFADPHFNVMDGLDIYVGDYTQPDPLPEGMLRKIASAHTMGFFDHEKKPAEDALEPLPDGAQAIAPAATQPRDDAEADGAADVAQSGVCNAIPSASSSEPEVAACSPAGDVAAMPASHSHNDHDAPLRLQPDDAPQRQSVGRGAA
ncbi:DUF3306 domain-containing protein [Acidovorax sp.]|uniref:DUF3306 domain-containing protein n=1 Tax=Acidovorax sp. TaxID=1872122 RepID=UPI0026157D6D|nr:DUF3306 domain-containing protein [Acidovorax sp.]